MLSSWRRSLLRSTDSDLLLFPLFTVAMSIFLGRLRRRTGSVWAGSAAHAANNGLADNLNRLAFTGRVDGVPSMSAMLPSLFGELVALAGIVLIDHVVGRDVRDETAGALQRELAA